MAHKPNARLFSLDELPTRYELWRRVQLARACLRHGRVNAVELLAILDGATISSLMQDERE